MISIGPYIDEYQCGSSDMVQSTVAKVAVRKTSTKPGPLTVARSHLGAAVRLAVATVRARISRKAKPIQRTK